MGMTVSWKGLLHFQAFLSFYIFCWNFSVECSMISHPVSYMLPDFTHVLDDSWRNNCCNFRKMFCYSCDLPFVGKEMEAARAHSLWGRAVAPDTVYPNTSVAQTRSSEGSLETVSLSHVLPDPFSFRWTHYKILNFTPDLSLIFIMPWKTGPEMSTCWDRPIVWIRENH